MKKKERLLRPRAEGVDKADADVLARAGLAQDQDARIAAHDGGNFLKLGPK